MRSKDDAEIAAPAELADGESAYNPMLDWDEDTEDGFDHSEDH